jgi:hypothetical protein
MKRSILSCSCLLLLGAVCFADDAPPAIGKPAPDFTVTGIDGKQFKLSEKTASGKNIVLMFDRAHW